MHPAFSILVFTTLASAAQGLVVLLAVRAPSRRPLNRSVWVLLRTHPIFCIGIFRRQSYRDDYPGLRGLMGSNLFHKYVNIAARISEHLLTGLVNLLNHGISPHDRLLKVAMASEVAGTQNHFRRRHVRSIASSRRSQYV